MDIKAWSQIIKVNIVQINYRSDDAEKADYIDIDTI